MNVDGKVAGDEEPLAKMDDMRKANIMTEMEKRKRKTKVMEGSERRKTEDCLVERWKRKVMRRTEMSIWSRWLRNQASQFTHTFKPISRIDSWGRGVVWCDGR